MPDCRVSSLPKQRIRRRESLLAIIILVIGILILLHSSRVVGTSTSTVKDTAEVAILPSSFPHDVG